MLNSSKSKSNVFIFALQAALNEIETISLSPFPLEVKYNILDFGEPFVKSYSLFRVMPVTLKRLA